MERINEYTGKGRTDSTGKLKIENRIELDAFLKRNPNKTIIFHFESIDVESLEGLRKSYFGHLIPQLKFGFIESGIVMNNTQTAEYVKQFSTVFQEEIFDEKECAYKTRERSFSELNEAEIRQAVRDLKQMAAENLHLDIK